LSSDLTQNWSNTSLISADNTWAAVPSIQGFRGDNLTTGIGVDPRTILADGSGTPINVLANRTNTNLTTGGVGEFHLANPVVALQGSVTADAPHLVLYLDATSVSGVTVSFTLRDIDGSANNAQQQVAVQYRVGGGAWANVPGGYVADATAGPGLAGLETPVSVVLPADADDQSNVQVRILTTNAAGFDEWIGIDDIVVTIGTPRVSVEKLADAAENGASGTFRFTRTGDLSQPLTVNVAVSGSATGGADYVALPATVTFVANSATATLTVTPKSDNEFEDADDDNDVIDPETVVLTVASGTEYVSSDSVATASITDDPPRVTTSVSWSQNSQTGELGHIVVTRSGGDLTQPLTAWVEIRGDVELEGDSVTAIMAAMVEFGSNETIATINAILNPGGGGNVPIDPSMRNESVLSSRPSN
jgi:hypothetical protein